MKWLPKFRIATALAFTTCFCGFLALNSIPWHGVTQIHYYGFGNYTFDQTSYGWPWGYSFAFSGADLPPQIKNEIDPSNPNGTHVWLNGVRKGRIISNVLIALLSSSLFGIIFEYYFRRFRS